MKRFGVLEMIAVRDTLAGMDLTGFETSLGDDRPPTGLTPALLALWWDGKGDWDRAHGYAQDDKSTDGSWVHAYLHRVEGDLSNAGYWYRRADKPASRAPLDDEWREIVTALL